MNGYPPNEAPKRIENDELGRHLDRLRSIYSDGLIEVTQWCMALDPLARPQSVFALQKELARETDRQYSKRSITERMKEQLGALTGSGRL